MKLISHGVGRHTQADRHTVRQRDASPVSTRDSVPGYATTWTLLAWSVGAGRLYAWLLPLPPVRSHTQCPDIITELNDNRNRSLQ